MVFPTRPNAHSIKRNPSFSFQLCDALNEIVSYPETPETPEMYREKNTVRTMIIFLMYEFS